MDPSAVNHPCVHGRPVPCSARARGEARSRGAVRGLAWALAVWLMAGGSLGASATDGPRPVPAPGGQEPRWIEGIESEAGSAARTAARESLEQGLAWLAKRQADGVEGSWPRGEAQFHAPIAVTALATLAFLAGGNGVDRGPHGREVARAVDYLIARTQRDERSPHVGFLEAPGDGTSRMHGHGYAVHAMAEAFTMSPQDRRGRRLAEVLPLALDLIQNTQGSEGGWWYDPWVSPQHEGSVTVVLVQAMRAARGAGFTVDSNVVRRAEDYVLATQVADGSFAYGIGSPRTTVALTAAGIGTLNAAGRYGDAPIRRGIDALWRDLGRREETGARSEFPFYERFYVAQALWQLGDDTAFKRWYEPELQRVLATQRADGSWYCPRYGDAYATAFQCLFLAIPDGLLPSFHR